MSSVSQLLKNELKYLSLFCSFTKMNSSVITELEKKTERLIFWPSFAMELPRTNRISHNKDLAGSGNLTATHIAR